MDQLTNAPAFKGEPCRIVPDFLSRAKQAPQFLGFVPGDQARRAQGWLITAILRDPPLENTKDMVIAHDMFLSVGAFLRSFGVSTQKGDRFGTIRYQYHGRFI